MERGAGVFPVVVPEPGPVVNLFTWRNCPLVRRSGDQGDLRARHTPNRAARQITCDGPIPLYDASLS